MLNPVLMNEKGQSEEHLNRTGRDALIYSSENTNE